MFKNISSLFCNKNSKISSESAEKLASKQKFLNNLLKHSSIISAEIYSHKIRTHSLKDYVV